MEIISFQLRFQADLGHEETSPVQMFRATGLLSQPPARSTFTPLALPSHPFCNTLSSIPFHYGHHSNQESVILSHIIFLPLSLIFPCCQLTKSSNLSSPREASFRPCVRAHKGKHQVQGDPGKQVRTPRIIKLCSLNCVQFWPLTLGRTLRTWSMSREGNKACQGSRKHTL